MTPSGNWYGPTFYFGLHYDLHAGPQDTDLGKNLKPAQLARSLARMQPDFVQTDCKGHPGMTSWFSRAPHATVSPGVVKDALAGWRAATRLLQIPLHCHYSGIWDAAAAKKHPEWAVVPSPGARAGWKREHPGKPALKSEKMCPRGGYLEGLMIPQLIELVDRYHVDGFWIDGDIWAVEPCYCARCRAEFKRQTGSATPPETPADPRWPAWMQVHRDGFEQYVTRYCAALHAHRPGIKICSNWLQTFKHPGPPTIPTDWISGDNSHNWGYDGSRCEARFIATRGKPWDLMLWAFYAAHGFGAKTSPWHFKPPQTLMQEAAVSLALGGNIQVYENPPGLRDGRLADWRLDRLGAVGRFVHQRRSVCQGATLLPQIAVLHSEAHFYAQASPHLHGGYDVTGVQGAVFSLLEHSYGVDILDEWALTPQLDSFPVVVVPEQHHLSAAMVTALKAYVQRGGRLLITGAATGQRFGWSWLGLRGARLVTDQTYFVPAGDGNFALFSKTWAQVQPAAAQPLGRLGGSCLPAQKLTTHPAAVVHRVGRGRVVFAPCDLFHDFQHNRYPQARVWVGELVAALQPKLALRVTAPLAVDVVLRAKPDQTVVHLINRASGLPTNPDNGAIDAIPPVGPVTIRLDCPRRPRAVKLALEKAQLRWTWRPTVRRAAGGTATITLPQVQIHAAVLVQR